MTPAGPPPTMTTSKSADKPMPSPLPNLQERCAAPYPCGNARKLHASADRPPQEDEDAGADEAGDQVTEPATKCDTKYPKQPVRQRGTHDAKNDVHEDARAGLHEHLGKPACQTAY